MENLRVTETNSAEETHGRVFGVEAPLFRWVVLCLLSGVALFAWLAANKGVGLLSAVWLILVPAAVVGLLLVVFSQNRHRSFPRDVAETIINGGDTAPGVSGSRRGGRLPNRLPDGYLLQDLIIYNGLGPGGYVAKGYWIEVPDLDHASEAERNRFDRKIQRLLRTLPSHYRVQVRWWVDSNYQDTLHTYRSSTAQVHDATCRKIRNSTFLYFFERMRRGLLRRQRVAIFLAKPITGKIPRRTRAAAKHHDALLAQSVAEFSEFGRHLHALLGGMGGGALPMTNEDYYQLTSKILNPSMADRFDSEWLKGFDPSETILQNCWHSQLRGRRTSRGFWLDDFEFGVLVLSKWPAHVYPTILRLLTNLPLTGYTISVNLRQLPVHRLLKQAQRELDRINQQLLEKPNERLMVTKAKLEERIQRLSQGDRVPLMAEVIIVARAPTAELLSERMLAIKSAIHSLHGASYAEGLPAFSKNCFLKTLPANLWSLHRGIELFGEHTFVSAMLPLNSSFVGCPNAAAIYLGTNGNIVGIGLYSGEGPKAMPLNLLVLGAPGMGKSEVVSNLVLQTAHLFGFIFIIEEGESHVSTTRALGGEPILFRLDGRQAINLFDTHGGMLTRFHRTTIVAMVCGMVGLPESHDQAHYRQALIAKHVDQFLSEFADDRIRHLNQAERRDLILTAMAIRKHATDRDISINDAFSKIRDHQMELHLANAPRDPELWEFESKNASLVRELVFARLAADEQPTLSAFQEYLEVSPVDMERTLCAQLATLLNPFCGDGVYAPIFDRPSNVSLASRIVHFELGSIPESAKQLKSLVALLLLNHLRQHLISMPKNQRKLLVLEELARLLSDLPGAESIVSEIYSQMRKANVLVISILQLLAQIQNPALRSAVLGNSPNLFIFNPGDRSDLLSLAQEVGLSPTAVEAILRYPRPSQTAGQTYSEFCYLNRDARRPVCGTVRHIQFDSPQEAGASVNKTNPQTNL